MQGETGGPKTPEGKQAVARNAIKHGILSADPVIVHGVETVERWEEFKQRIAESWDAQGDYERELARDIAYNMWRLRRCQIYEAATVNTQIEKAVNRLFEPPDDDDDDDDWDEDEEDEDQSPAPDPEPEPEPVEPDPEPEEILARHHTRILPYDDNDADLIIRYESHVRKALFQSIHELEAHQARRNGETAHLARVEFNAGPSFAKRRRTTAMDIPGLPEARERVRMAEVALMERRLASRGGDT